jgi:hypothetical protein
MRHSEKEKKAFKKKHKKKARLQKRKESAIITAKKIISPENTDRLRPIMRKSTIPKKNKNEKLRKSLNRENLEKL